MPDTAQAFAATREAPDAIAGSVEIHPAAQLFPRMGEQEYAALREDIRQNGIVESIVVDAEGRILDGRHRAAIAAELTVPCPHRTWAGPGSPVDLVISLNLHRRHLTPGQAAMIADDARDLYVAEARDRMSAGGRRAQGVECVPPLEGQGKSRDQVGKVFGVAGRTVDYARFVKETCPDLAAQVRAGQLALATAVRECQRVRRARLSGQSGGEPDVAPVPRTRPPNRWDDLAELAAEGHTSEQIARKLGVGPAAVTNAAKRLGIAVHANRVVGKHRRYDPARMLRAIVAELEAVAPSCEMIDFANVGADVLTECKDRLAKTMKVLRTLERRLTGRGCE